MSGHQIPRLSDQEIIAKLMEVRSEILPGADFEFSVHAFEKQLGTFSTANVNSTPLKAILDQNGSSIEIASATIVAGVGLSYHRGGTNPPRSAYFDELRIHVGDQHPDRFAFGAKILKIFRPFEFSGTGVDGLQDVSAVRAIQEETLNRLERLHEDGIRRVQESQAVLEKAFQKRHAALEEQFDLKRRGLDKEVASETEALAARQAQLEARNAQLDDRDNTHARRDNRTRMLNDVRERFEKFGVTEATEQKRGPVKTGILFLASVLMFFAIMSWADVISRDIFKNESIKSSYATPTTSPASSPSGSIAAASSQNESAPYVLWIRSSLLTLGVAATVLFYIRWQSAWAEQHSRSEFALQQFHIDVNRANWVMESCLEWHKTTGAPIPESLINAFTRGLFTSGDSSPPPALHPADELASALIGSASKLRLKAGDSEIEFDKPGKIPNKTQNAPNAT